MGLSRMRGNFHVRFLGGERAAMPLATGVNVCLRGQSTNGERAAMPLATLYIGYIDPNYHIISFILPFCKRTKK